MSDGGFDADMMIKSYRNRENFGVVFDPHTSQHVMYPSIPKYTESIQKTPFKEYKCQKCESANICKLEEEGFIELCPL